MKTKSVNLPNDFCFKLDELAAFLPVTKGTIRRHITEGKLIAFHISKSVNYKDEAIYTFRVLRSEAASYIRSEYPNIELEGHRFPHLLPDGIVLTTQNVAKLLKCSTDLVIKNSHQQNERFYLPLKPTTDQFNEMIARATYGYSESKAA